MIAIDFESWPIQPGLLTPKAVCMSAHDGTTTSLLLAKDAKALFLEALRVGVIGHNLSYDLGVAAAYWPDVLPAIFECLDGDRAYDTMLLEMLFQNTTPFFFVDPETNAPLKGYSLAYLEKIHLGRDRSAEKENPDAWRLRYSELDGIPVEEWPAEASQYATDDAEGTYRVFEKQSERAAGLNDLPASSLMGGNYDCIHDEVRAAWALHLTSAWGVRTDELMVRKVAHDIDQLHESSRQKFLAAGLIKVRKAKGGREPEVPDFQGPDGRGMKYQADTKAIQALVSKAYLGRPPLTPTLRVTMKAEHLADSGDDLLIEFAETDKNEDFKSKYLPIIIAGARTPINARYRSLLKTGRTSCSEPPLQQLPRLGPIRECFIPRPGFVFTSVDYQTQELVTLAQVQLNWFGRSALADAINAGQDVHIRMASRFLGVTYDELYARRKEPGVKKVRQAAKPANFGLPGLMGAPRLVATAKAQHGIRFCEYIDGGDCKSHERITDYKKRTIPPTCVRCLEIAEQIKQAWFAEWPEMKDTLAICTRLYEDGEVLPIPLGGMSILATDKPGTYANGVFQGSAATCSKRALYEVVRASYEGDGILMGNCRPVVFLHDEILAEVREEVASECADEIAKIMVASMRKFTPDVRVTAEPCLMRRWFKGAEMRRGADGRLVPDWPADWSWEPDLKQMELDRMKQLA